ncbi:MAG TPA: UDP-N-acetylmuramoyl-L-alanine--D-glutamate ligase [Candidatus Binatia bacterium]|nr:UDP-N-acetylmuramoyl-L-alanine--D-glutamate ligase [Candidatus Binatia bacterium]
MELKDKTVLVVGLGRTGRDSARFLAQQGARVLVNDFRPAAELRSETNDLSDLAIEYRLGGEHSDYLNGIDYVIPSPGVARENVLLQEASARRIPILSEIELAYRFIRAPLIAITGTNGKSTATTLVGEMLRAAGKKVFVGGNLGVPFISAVSDDWDWTVLEISSFQLEWVKQFRPRVAVLLNLSEDHLDRYASFAEYGATKARIFEAQTSSDTAILNRDDPSVWEMRKRLKSRVVSFGFAEAGAGVFAAGNELIWRDGGAEERFSLADVKLHGIHNLENMMAAVAAAKSIGFARDAIQTVLNRFPGLEHRLEFVREKDGVAYYNDSKGTNVGAVVKSLESFSAPVVLLAGGVDKGGSYAPLERQIKEKVRRLVLFGAAKEIIARALGALTDTVIVEDLPTAVRDAAAHSQPGDVVLLSPACSSFDQFKNYVERGRAFKTLVQEL